MVSTFLDIPVYRIPEKQYYKERAQYVENVLYQGTLQAQKEQREHHRKNPDQKAYMVGHIEESYGGPWRYNEIVGFIRLHFVGRQIRGEYFATKPKRKVRTRKKQFEYKTWKLAPEIDIPQGLSDREIFKVVCDYVEKCRKELPRRYIDASHLEALGPHVKWEALIEDQRNV